MPHLTTSTTIKGRSAQGRTSQQRWVCDDHTGNHRLGGSNVRPSDQRYEVMELPRTSRTLAWGCGSVSRGRMVEPRVRGGSQREQGLIGARSGWARLPQPKQMREAVRFWSQRPRRKNGAGTVSISLPRFGLPRFARRVFSLTFCFCPASALGRVLVRT